MSEQQNLDVVPSLYTAFGRGDLEGAIGEAAGILARALRPAGAGLGRYIRLVDQRTTTRDHYDECRRLQEDLHGTDFRNWLLTAA